MSCDCLTKSMPEDYLVRILDTNLWDVSQSEEAKAIKLRKAAGVQRRKAERSGDGDAATSSAHARRDASKFSEHSPDAGCASSASS